MTAPVDLQVNGYAGVDFNQDALSAEQLHAACERLAADGVGAILATITTEHLDAMCARIQRIVRCRERDDLARRVIAGIHVEGPFLNPNDGFRGAHPADAILPATLDAAGRLLDAGEGQVRLVTLAPECDPDHAVVEELRKRGVVVAAGHTDASLTELRDAASAGVTLFTHVGNGCPAELPRHDNIVQRALALSDRLWMCFIADGVHVPFFALNNYLRAAGIRRSIVVTDAIAAAGLGPGRYRFGRWELVVGDDMAARAPDGSHLVGSAVTMPQSLDNLRRQLGFTDEQASLLVADNPRQALGIA